MGRTRKTTTLTTDQEQAWRPKEPAYVIRTSNKNGTSRHDGVFRWPTEGYVECNDWKPTPTCGNGLHGLLRGHGDIELLGDVKELLVQIVEVDASEVVPIENDKVKFPRGNVIFSGDYDAALVKWAELGLENKMLPYGLDSATGTSGSASATGYSGSASATGYSGSASATGTRGSASATGTSGSASATGYSGSASATGYSGSASATGYSGSASATGTRGSASATGTRGSASATGYSGSASATGTSGSASATGYSGSASATGTSGSASATGTKTIAIGEYVCGRDGALLVAKNYNETEVFAAIGRVGEDGILPDTWYYASAPGVLTTTVHPFGKRAGADLEVAA